MEITRTARAEEVEIRLKGRMDGTWSDHVSTALAECVRSGQHRIAVDMAAVDYISSAGIRVLVLYARQLRTIQGRFQVTNASSVVRRVLELAGLDKLLLVPAAGEGAAAQPGEVPAGKAALREPGAAAEVYELDAGATLRVQWPGSAAEWFEGRTDPGTCAQAQFPTNAMGIGLGALVSGDASSSQPFGEFLAAGGAAVCQPADGSHKPDYLLLQGALEPAIKIAYGLLGHGAFRHLLRFDKGQEQPSLPLSSVVRACLEVSGSELTGLVMVAETASLIGAAAQQATTPPADAGRAHDIFSFPEVRDRLSFTAEPAFANSTSLVVGFAATKARGPEVRLLKPMAASRELYGHFHAVALPYHPLRKGKVDLAGTIRPLFETEQVLGVLHLLNDWREANGAGESQFLRGACWFAPATQ